MGICLASTREGSDCGGPREPAQGSRRRWSAVAGLALSLTVAGCLLPSVPGAPPRPLSVETELTGLAPSLRAINFDDAASEQYRDSVVSARMWAIDLNYSTFATELSRERRNIGFLSALGIVGLTQTATLMTPVVTKDILTAVASGVVVAQQSYDQEILADRTVQVLLLQMQANRARVAARILTGLRSPTSDYPLILALQDVEDYYRAGTIAGALTSVTEAAGTEVRAAEAAKSAVVTARYVEDDWGEILQRNLFPDGSTVDQARLQQVLDRLQKLGEDVDISLLLRGDRYRDLRRRVVTSLGWT